MTLGAKMRRGVVLALSLASITPSASRALEAGRCNSDVGLSLSELETLKARTTTSIQQLPIDNASDLAHWLRAFRGCCKEAGCQGAFCATAMDEAISQLAAGSVREAHRSQLLLELIRSRGFPDCEGQATGVLTLMKREMRDPWYGDQLDLYTRLTADSLPAILARSRSEEPRIRGHARAELKSATHPVRPGNLSWFTEALTQFAAHERAGLQLEWSNQDGRRLTLKEFLRVEMELARLDWAHDTEALLPEYGVHILAAVAAAIAISPDTSPPEFTSFVSSGLSHFAVRETAEVSTAEIALAAHLLEITLDSHYWVPMEFPNAVDGDRGTFIATQLKRIANGIAAHEARLPLEVLSHSLNALNLVSSLCISKPPD